MTLDLDIGMMARLDTRYVKSKVYG